MTKEVIWTWHSWAGLLTGATVFVLVVWWTIVGYWWVAVDAFALWVIGSVFIRQRIKKERDENKEAL